MKVLDLFSGIGGFSLGLESTGYFKTIAFCEKDKFCQKILQKNFPNIPIESEVRDVKGEKYAAEVVTGGFPCQPFSIAGKRKGTDDDRYLWDETIRIVAETKPKWFIGENVEGIINIQNGMVLRQVQNDLEGEGFQVQCLVIPASGIGAWHQRKRTWIIANSKTFRGGEPRELDKKKGSEKSYATQFNSSSEDAANSKSKRSLWSSKSKSSFNEQQRLDINKKRNRSEIRSNSSRRSEQNYRDVSNTNQERLQRLNNKQKLSKKKFRLPANKDDERRQTWWQTQSKLCGIPDGVSYELDKDRSNRIKALGNSIVPQIARELGLAIIEAEHEA